ncbi:MAG: hypothetical protein AAGG02_01565 [Cyanobacteria bacterium P01_H01_bin.15]
MIICGIPFSIAIAQPSLAPSRTVNNPEEAPYDTYMRLGFAAAEREDYQTAMAYFRDALFYVPDDREATIAYWNSRKAFNAQHTPNDATPVESDYDLFMRLGYEETNARDYQSALINFQKALSERDGDYYATQAIRNVSSYVAAKKGQSLDEIAIVEFSTESAHYVGESAYDRYMRLGYAATQAQKFTEATELFYSALTVRPGDRLATIAFWNAKHNLNAQNPDGTQKSDLSNYNRLMRLGYDATQAHQFAKALTYFEAALQEKPNDEYAIQAIRNLDTYIQQGKTEE